MRMFFRWINNDCIKTRGFCGHFASELNIER